MCACCGRPVLAPAGADGRPLPTETVLCARCAERPPAIAISRSVGDYQGELRAVIHALKYGRHRSIAARLAAQMASCGADALRGADAVVPVPLHWRRRWLRGFNQSSLLAGHLPLPVWPALRRVRATRPQVKLPADDRRQNVRRAFALARGPAAARLRTGDVLARLRRVARQRSGRDALALLGQSWERMLRGSVVVLVDDVTTTGSTLEACRQVLAAAGAREVRAITAARVPGSR